MIRATDLQVLPLEDLEQGHTLAIVVTNAQSAVTLQFRHAGDPTYRNHPDFTAVAPVATVIAKSVLCCSTDMRLSFASAQAANLYYVSCIAAASATF